MLAPTNPSAIGTQKRMASESLWWKAAGASQVSAEGMVLIAVSRGAGEGLIRCPGNGRALMPGATSIDRSACAVGILLPVVQVLTANIAHIGASLARWSFGTGNCGTYPRLCSEPAIRLILGTVVDSFVMRVPLKRGNFTLTLTGPMFRSAAHTDHV